MPTIQQVGTEIEFPLFSEAYACKWDHQKDNPDFKDLQPLKSHPHIPNLLLSFPLCPSQYLFSSLIISLTLSLSPHYPPCLSPSLTLPTTYTSQQSSGCWAEPEITPPPVSLPMVSLMIRRLTPLLHNSSNAQYRAHTEPGEHLLSALCTHSHGPPKTVP